MHESAHQGGCHLLIVEDIDPPGEFQVRVEDDGFVFVYLGEIIKQELCSGAVVRNIPPLVQDNDGSLVDFSGSSLFHVGNLKLSLPPMR